MPPRRPKQVTRPQTASSESLPEPDDNAAQQFQLELWWCIQQLEGALSSNKMNTRQEFLDHSFLTTWLSGREGHMALTLPVQDASKSLSVLRSKTAPMVKKRQVMRVSFGDYRAKMAEEEKKMNKAQNKVSIVASSPNLSSRFVKRSCAIMPGQNDNSFRFNFEVEADIPCEKKEQTSSNSFSFHSSDNNFRFNFTEPECS